MMVRIGALIVRSWQRRAQNGNYAIRGHAISVRLRVQVVVVAVRGPSVDGNTARPEQSDNQLSEVIVNRPDNRLLLARRQIVAALGGVTLLPIARSADAQGGARPSPTQTLGPFYPRNTGERPRSTDADLLVVEGERVLTRGTPIFLLGRVVDRELRPVSGAAVEIWQCDAMSVYHHPAGGAESERDPNFQGYGVDRTDAAGTFRFRTILPVAYPGRTPHIHVRIQPERGSSLATQLYLPDAPGNARDFLFSRLRPDEQQALLLKLEPSRDTAHPLAHSTRLTASTQLVLG